MEESGREPQAGRAERPDEALPSIHGIKQLVDQERWNEAKPLFLQMPAEQRARVLEECGGWMLDVRFGPHIFTEFSLSPTCDFVACPRLELAKAAHLARCGLAEEARWLLDHAEARRAPAVDGTTWPAELRIIRVRLMIFADQPVSDADIAGLEAQMNDDLSANPVLYAITPAVLCDALYGLGRYQGSRDIGLRALALGEHYRMPFAASYVFALTALAEYRLGNLDEAIKLTDRLAEHVRDNFPASSTLHDVAAIIAAVMLAEKGRVAEAEALLDRPLGPVMAAEGWLELCNAGYFTAVNISIQRRDYDRALAILADARKCGARHGFGRLIQMAHCRALYLLSMADRKAEAEQVAAGDAVPTTARQQAENWWRDYVSTSDILSANALLLAHGRFEDCLRNLDEHLSDLSGIQNVPIFVRLMCLKLVALTALERPSDIIADVVRTISFYGERGYLGPMLQLRQLHGALKSYLARTDLSFEVRRLGAKLAARLKASLDDSLCVSSRLSPRQTQILALLADGLSNKEIARQLELAEGTVKSYRKTLYQKLNVSRRSQAVAQAPNRT